MSVGLDVTISGWVAHAVDNLIYFVNSTLFVVLEVQERDLLASCSLFKVR